MNNLTARAMAAWRMLGSDYVRFKINSQGMMQLVYSSDLTDNVWFAIYHRLKMVTNKPVFYDFGISLRIDDFKF